MTCVMGNNCFVTVFIVKMARLYGYILLPLLPRCDKACHSAAEGQELYYSAWEL